MRSTNNKLLISVCASLFLIFLLFLFPALDNGIVGGISNLRSDGLDRAMDWVTNIGSGIVIFFIITALFLYEERKRKWIIPLWLSFFLASLITLALKLLVARERPFELLGLAHANEFAFWDSSFPSWHAVMAFSALPVLDREFSRIKIFWIAFALLIIFSRLYFGVHFLSDVVAGALLGYLSGFLFVRIWENHVWKRNKAKAVGKRAHGRR